MTERTVPSVGASLVAVIALTWKRLVRGRTLWVAIGLAALPIAFAAVLQSMGKASSRMVGDLIAFEQLLLALLPALLIASSIGEEIEDRTTTYLWSRPVARWVVLVGKLATLTPVGAVLSVASWYAAMQMGAARAPSLGSCLAMAAGAAALSMVAGGIATLAPRYGMALAVVYTVFFDLAVGAMPLSLRNLSITFQQRALIDALARDTPPEPSLTGLVPPTALAAGIALAVLGAVWLAIALWRFGRREA